MRRARRFVAVLAGASVDAILGKSWLGNPADLPVILLEHGGLSRDPRFDFFAVENSLENRLSR
jgi:hypothetical protein